MTERSPEEIEDFMRKLCRDCGEYDVASEVKSENNTVDEWFDKHQDTLGQKMIRNGQTLADIVFNNRNKVKFPRDWKKVLKQLITKAYDEKRTPNDVMQMSRMANQQINRYVKDDIRMQKDKSKNAYADVFFLIDNSGSMISLNTRNTATGQMMSFQEVICDLCFDMISRTKMKNGYVQYFDNDIIGSPKKGVYDNVNVSQAPRAWTCEKNDKNRKKRYEIFAPHGRDERNNGGTNVTNAIHSVHKLGRPYFEKNKTILITITDIETSEINSIASLDPKCKKKLIFILINDKHMEDGITQKMIEMGIPKNQICFIPNDELKKFISEYTGCKK